MDSGLRSRKRKQRSSESDPFGGIFTRSRSQIYFHRHRSGYARADSNQSRNLIKSLTGTAESLLKQEQSQATADQITSQVSVKDLRARRVFSPAAIANDGASIGEVDLEGAFDVHKKNDGNPNVSASEGDAGHSELGVSYSAANDLKASPEKIADFSSIRETNLMEAAEIVQVAPTIADSDQNKRPGEKHGTISVANVIADTQGSISKNQSSVTSLRSRRKVFKSPSSFSYRRLLPYLTNLGNNDSSSFEIIEETLPKVQTSSNTVPNMAVCKDEKNGLVSNCSKLADGSSNNAKSCEKQFSDCVNPALISTVEGSNVVQKSQEDVVNGKVEECEQKTPPDSDIYSESNIDKSLGVLVKPKLVLKSCSRMKVLQTPTSFSHRRLLPFLMNVSGDDSCVSKGNQSLNLEDTEQNQQPPTHSLLRQIVSMDESKTNSNSEQPSAADEKTDSPTSTLIPIDASIDRIESITLVSNDILLDVNGQDKECSGSISQLEVNSQAEAIKSDSSIKLEQTSPKNNLKLVEEATSKAIETLPNICTEQSNTNIEFTGLRNSYCEDNQKAVNESTQQSSLQIAPLNGILKRTPRGCRGICNCLICTSFRLHAERSFEFSRNQLHDAEEVALELINNLTCLRNILERTTSDSNSLATVHVTQVKEACAKALHKEQVARARLAQMNEDLSFHCRSTVNYLPIKNIHEKMLVSQNQMFFKKLLRPSVTFANKIEEKVISKNEVYGRNRV